MEHSEIAMAYVNDHRLLEIAIHDMDGEDFLLVDAQGQRYHEVTTNVWAHRGGSCDDVVYLGTGRHGGGIILRPLYVRIDGAWYNVTTGREAPRSMQLS